MKKVILLFWIVSISLTVWGQAPSTNDYLRIVQNQSFKPGVFDDEGDYFAVELVGANDEEQKYKTIQASIILPEGLSVNFDDGYWVDIDNSSNIYPTKRGGVLYHKLECSYGLNGPRTLTIAIAPGSDDKELKERTGSLFKVYVRSTGYTKPGNLEVRFENVKFIISENEYYVPANQPTQTLTVLNTSTVPVSVSAEAKWGTCILPFSCALPSGVKAYTCDSKDTENLLLTEVAQLAAYTPYILYSEAGYSGNLSGTVDANQYPAGGFVKSGYLSGAVVPQTVNSGYVLQNLSEGVKFYSCGGDEFNIPAGKCWVNVDAVSARERLGFKVENSLTGISNVAESSDANAIYTLSGVRVKSAAAPGLYVVNKKKVMKK